jgi:hypothetical protein
MLARMNFASTLAANQRFRLAASVGAAARSPEALVSRLLDSMKTAQLDRVITSELAAYLRATGEWTGSVAQLQDKVPGLVHLVAGTAEYQFV